MENQDLLTFKEQIDADIKLIQKDFVTLDKNLENQDYAFIYWILTKLYSIDETECPELITEYGDKGMDAFVFYEETKELFLIQAKYYDIQTTVHTTDVSDFLTRPLTYLSQGKYTKSAKLQKIYNKYSKDPGFKLYLHFYATSTKYSGDIPELIKRFNINNRNNSFLQTSGFFDLGCIYTKFYGESYKPTKNMIFNLGTINKGTLAKLIEEYNIPELRCKAYYIITPVSEIYRLKKDSDDKGYSLFEENIREYLGESSVNSKIIATLKDPKTRKNFLFYNNGITIIAKDASKSEIKGNMTYTPLSNPQVVNGCQTVNSIYTVLDTFTENEIEKDFSSVFVMVKVLIIDANNEDDKHFYKEVVQFTNSQNAVPDKVFTANEEPIFIRLQNSLKDRGLFLKVKQSDKYKYSQISTVEKNKLLEKAKFFADKVGYNDLTTSDISVDLDKFLQIMLVFRTDAMTGYQKKSYVLKRDSSIFKEYTLNLQENINADNMIYLYFFYKRAFKDQNTEKRKNAYYMLSFLTYFKQKNKSSKTNNNLATSIFSLSDTDFNILYNYLQSVSFAYFNFKMAEPSGKNDYNSIIKSKIDATTLDTVFASLNVTNDTHKIFDLLNCD